MIEQRTWAEFRESGLLWFANRLLHLVGWAIVVVVENDGTISEVYPARVKFRGFDQASESEGFTRVTKHIADNIAILLDDVTK